MRGTLVGAAFVVLLIYSLHGWFENTELVRTLFTREPESQFPPVPAATILNPVLSAFFLGLATSGVWAYFACSRLGLLGATVMGVFLPLFFSFTTSELNEYLSAMTFIIFDPPDQTVPAAVAQLSGREPQPLYLTILYTFTSLLPGVALWAGLRWARLGRL